MNSHSASRRKAFWVGVALLPLVAVVFPPVIVYGFVRFKLWEPAREWLVTIGAEFLRDRPWESKS